MDKWKSCKLFYKSKTYNVVTVGTEHRITRGQMCATFASHSNPRLIHSRCTTYPMAHPMGYPQVAAIRKQVPERRDLICRRHP